MAANNYFGFTTGGTQYGTAPAAAAAATYQATQAAAAAAAAGYAVQHATQPYATATPRASQAAYETYQAAGHTTTTYPYASRQQAYEKAQTYYPQPTQVAYSTTETAHYQSAVTKPSYTASTPAYTSPRPAAGQKSQGPTTQTGSTSSYMFPSGAASNTTGSYTSTYNAPATTNYSASMYVQQTSMGGQAGSTGTASVGTNATQAAPAGTAVGANKVATASWASFRKGPLKPQKPKQPPKPQQLHYCEVCKISCAGPQTYREHLEGQKHKKKEAAMKAGTNNQNVRGGTSLRCELCDVTCTGSDAYAAHIRGSKHQKVVKLHTKLGKPIPSTEPVVISNATNSPVSSTTTGTTSTAKSSAGTTTTGKTSNSTADASKKIIGAPKINFVGGSKLSTTTKEDPKTDEDEAKDDLMKMDDKPDVQPVGQDYIEEIKNDEGKVISFQCKLCECRFNDPNAKEMHMKGRRHRLQYKRKVNPDLVVDIKPSLRQRKIQEERLRRQQMREDYWKRREEERWREEMRMMEEEERMYWEERRRYEEEMEYYEYYRRYGRDPRLMPPPPMPPRSFAPPLMPPMGPAMGGTGKRPESSDDKHVLAKHTMIYPKEEELAMVQKIVTNTEKALKLVSDFLAESDAPPASKTKEKEEAKDVKKEPAATPAAKKEPLIAKEPLIKEPLLHRDDEMNSDQNHAVFLFSADKNDEENLGNQPQRALKGVMRVGVLAKGLLLTGDQAVQLVVMCSEKPTRTLLDRVADNLPKQLATVAPDEKYEVKRCVEEAALVVTALAEPKMSVTITLTSPVMRETASGEDATTSTPAANPAAPVESIKDPPDVLDRQKCLEALAALRHAKWFQARASGLPSCVMIIRILRDLCQRVPTWGRLNSWATELLVEKVISSIGQSLSPGDALRRVLEAIAFGILLPGGPGLMDPCEKDPFDAAGSLTNQEREDITASAQHALRLIAFRQIHKVLGMDPLPPPKFTRNQFSRKRRRDTSAGEGNDSEGADGKKDKKDDSEVKAEGMETDVQAKA